MADLAPVQDSATAAVQAFAKTLPHESMPQPREAVGLARVLLAFGKLPPFCRGKLRGWTARAVLKAAGSPLLARFRGAVFAVHDDGHPTEYSILLYPRYDSAEFDFLLEGLGAGGTAVDLGSNIGLYSLPLAAKAGPHGKVLAIDASAAFAAKLAVNARLSGLPNVIQDIVAVGDRVGEVCLTPVPGNPGTAVISQQAGGSTVAMLPLLDILVRNGISQIDVMKVDIDGSEEIALVPFLLGAERSLLPNRIVMEHVLLGAAASALPEALTRAGYTLCKKTRVNSFYVKSA